MKIITLAWGEPYLQFAACLKKNAAQFGLDCEIITVDGAPASPRDAYRMKPGLIRDRLKTDSVLFLDADTVLHRSPVLLQKLAQDPQVDAAAYSPRRGYYVDGVILANPTDGARAWLDAWEEIFTALGETFADTSIWAARTRTQARVYHLPPDHCWVKAWGMKDRYGNHEPIIEPNGRMEDPCCDHSPSPLASASPDAASLAGSATAPAPTPE